MKIKTKPIFRIVEVCKAYDSYFGEGKGWIYQSNEIDDYYEAIKQAILLDKLMPWNKHWVELYNVEFIYAGEGPFLKPSPEMPELFESKEPKV